MLTESANVKPNLPERLKIVVFYKTKWRWFNYGAKRCQIKFPRKRNLEVPGRDQFQDTLAVMPWTDGVNHTSVW